MPMTSIRKDTLYMLLCIVIIFFILILVFDFMVPISASILYLYFVFCIQEEQKMRDIYNVSAGRIYEPYYSISKKLIDSCKKFTVKRYLETILYSPFFALYMYYQGKSSYFMIACNIVYIVVCERLIELYVDYKKIEFNADYEIKIGQLIDKSDLVQKTK